MEDRHPDPLPEYRERESMRHDTARAPEVEGANMAANAAAQDVLREIGRRMGVPVIAIEDAAGATPLGDALVEGGLPIAEITCRTEAARSEERSVGNGRDTCE